MARLKALRNWGAALLILPSGHAFADMRGDILANISRCSALTDDRQWLDCVYGSVQPMRSRLGLPPASEGQIRLSGTQPTIAPPPRNSGGGNFGVSAPPLNANTATTPGPNFGLRPAAPAFNGVAANLSSFTLDSHGKFTVTLANGQVWRQLSGDTAQADWNKAKAAHYVIKITPGFLGSFNLAVEGQPDRFKVERLK